MRKQDRVVLWPVYFDATKSRGEGRKVPKAMAVPSPKISELKEAVDRLGLEHEISPDALYPKAPWLKMGMLLVVKKGPKNQLMKKIARQLLKMRASGLQKNS